MVKKVNISFDFSEESAKSLDWLADRVGGGSRAAVLRNALTLYARACYSTGRLTWEEFVEQIGEIKEDEDDRKADG